MTNKEKSIIVKLSEIIPKLNSYDKRYLLGVADGMAVTYKSRKETHENRNLERSQNKIHRKRW